MRQRWMTGMSIVAVGLLGGCGGGQSSSPSSQATGKSLATPSASGAPSGIRGRLLTNNELGGFTSADAKVFPSIAAWLAQAQLPPGQVAAEKAMLQRNGFREAAREDLTNSGNTAALSLVEQFRSPHASRAALVSEVAAIKAGAAGTLKAFVVHGIPGAEGFADTQNSGSNIAFSNGPYYYLVGQMSGGPTAIASLNAAALHLYRRLIR